MQSVFSQYGDPSVPNTQRQLGLRRRRDVPPCMECRRLKMKCDRNWPCAHCVRRGCADICPNTNTVRVSVGQHPRAASPERDETEVSELRERVRQLEAALASVVGPAHPLLGSDEHQSTEDADTGVASASTSHTLPTSTTPVDQNTTTDLGYLLDLGSNFPMALDASEIEDPEATLREIYALLPSLDQANILTKTFYEGFGHKIPAIPEAIFSRRLADVYSAPVKNDLESVHMLGLVFIALALARFRSGEDSDTFFYLSKALFTIKSSVDSTSDITVHGLFLIAMYCRLTNRSSAAWVTSGLIGRLVIANNFHHDPSRWGIEGDRAEYWRSTFWEVYSMDMIYSLTVQRAPAFNIRYVDCKMPVLEVESSDLITRTNALYHLWMYRFTSEVLPGVLEQTCGKGPASYTAVIKLDRTVRESWIPSSLLPDRTKPVEDDGPPDAPFQRFVILWYREFTLLSLHKTPLEVALLESANDVLAHRCAASVLAAFRSACTLGRAMCAISRNATPRLRAYRPYFWQAAFVATTVLGALALMTPNSTLGPPARTEALILCDLYETTCLAMPSKIQAWLDRLKQKLTDSANAVAPNEVVQGAPEWDTFGPDEVDSATLRLTRHPATIVTVDKILQNALTIAPQVQQAVDSITFDHVLPQQLQQQQSVIEPDVMDQWDGFLRMLGLPSESD